MKTETEVRELFAANPLAALRAVMAERDALVARCLPAVKAERQRASLMLVKIRKGKYPEIYRPVFEADLKRWSDLLDDMGAER